ncbi:hypothetical protein IAU60_005217 [Kwoniella sp. DSM 27419]
MSFLPLSPCCLTGGKLTGELRGKMEPPEGDRKVLRYHARPVDGQVVDPKAAVVLYTDAFGLELPNPKVMADAFAEQLKLDVFVPEYIPEPPPVDVFDHVAAMYPGQNKDRSWFTTIKLVGWVVSQIYPWMPMLFQPKKQVPLAQAALDDIIREGYTSVGVIGYCRGGAMVQYLLASDTAPPALKCGVACHPSAEKALWGNIHQPTLWHLADQDMMFGDKEIKQLKEVFEKKKADQGVEFDCYVHTETVHGFAARPVLEHEPTKKAFEEANATAVDFFKKHLLAT